MSEQTTANAELAQDITAKELMEKFGLNEEQATKLAAALPELLKEMMGEKKNYPYPYPTPKTNSRDAITDAEAAFSEIADALILIYSQPILMDKLHQTLKAKLPATKIHDSLPQKMVLTDSLSMDMINDSIKLTDGILTADCVATAAMVQDYNGKKVLKDPEELRKATNFARQLPITDTHPKDGIVTAQSEIKGWTSPLSFDDTKKRIVCNVQITDGKLIKKIQDGKKDVSIGFFCDVEDKEGEYDGKKYSSIQTNIVLNHLAAGIDNGRCPTGICGIGQDETPASEPKKEEAAPTEKQTEEKPTDAKKFKCPKCGNEQANPGPCEKCGTEVTELKPEEKPMEKEEEKPIDKCAPKTPEELKKEEEEKAKEAEKKDCDCGACPPEKHDVCTKKDDKAGADEETLGLVDSIMDYKPPHDREHYLSKTKADLKDLLTLLRAKADSKAPINKSSSKPANKDEAYSRLADGWRKR